MLVKLNLFEQLFFLLFIPLHQTVGHLRFLLFIDVNVCGLEASVRIDVVVLCFLFEQVIVVGIIQYGLRSSSPTALPLLLDAVLFACENGSVQV